MLRTLLQKTRSEEGNCRTTLEFPAHHTGRDCRIATARPPPPRGWGVEGFGCVGGEGRGCGYSEVKHEGLHLQGCQRHRGALRRAHGDLGVTEAAALRLKVKPAHVAPATVSRQCHLHHAADWTVHEQVLEVHTRGGRTEGGFLDPVLVCNPHEHCRRVQPLEGGDLHVGREGSLHEALRLRRCPGRSNEEVPPTVLGEDPVLHHPALLLHPLRSAQHQHVPAPDHQSLTVALATPQIRDNRDGTVLIPADPLRLVQRLAHTPGVVLEEPAVHHQLDLTIVEGGAALSRICQDCKTGRRVGDGDASGHRVVIVSDRLQPGELPVPPPVPLAVHPVPAVRVGLEVSSVCDVGTVTHDDLPALLEEVFGEVAGVLHGNRPDGVLELEEVRPGGETHGGLQPVCPHVPRLGCLPRGSLEEADVERSGHRRGTGGIGAEEVGAAGQLRGLSGEVVSPVLLQLVHLSGRLVQHTAHRPVRLEAQLEHPVRQRLRRGAAGRGRGCSGDGHKLVPAVPERGQLRQEGDDVRQPPGGHTLTAVRADRLAGGRV
eukprot:Hpha_TRINITY_DN16210_c0_g7::TRINITY_DN16210_c0_g7_i1::g.14073::m.14073